MSNAFVLKICSHYKIFQFSKETIGRLNTPPTFQNLNPF